MPLLKNFLQPGYIATCFNHIASDEVELLGAQLFREAAGPLIDIAESKEREGHAFWVPGRIELLGKHVDYAGGKSITAALQRGFAFVVMREAKPYINVIDGRSNQQVQFNLNTGALRGVLPWGRYVQTVVERVQRNFGLRENGATICFASNLPSAAGLSSSSALITGLFLALKAIYPIAESAVYNKSILNVEELADYLGHIENGQTYKELKGNKGVGTMGGSQDHAAILCSREKYFRLFSYKPIYLVDEVVIPEELVLCIASSGVRAEKTRNAKEKYNSCSVLVKHIIDCLDPHAEQTDYIRAHYKKTC